MTWKASPPAIEIAAAWTAAACLGGAMGFAVARIAPLGAGWIEASVAGVCVVLAGGTLVGRIDRHRRSHPPFVVAELRDGDFVDDRRHPDYHADDEPLLLDDPLPRDHDERVVRLFAAHPIPSGMETPLIGPGEMAARIDTFLGNPRGVGAIATVGREPDRAAVDDASAALHAALADIRRSLRHG